MKIGLFGDSWYWDWRFDNTQTNSSPSPFATKLKQLGYECDQHAHPATNLASASDLMNCTDYDVYIVFATDPVRNLQTHSIDPHSLIPQLGDPDKYHAEIRKTLSKMTAKDFVLWCENTQNRWLDTLPTNKTLVMGGAGPLRPDMMSGIPGIPHCKNWLYPQYSKNNYVPQCTQWFKDCVNDNWHPTLIDLIHNQLDLLDSWPGEDQTTEHLSESELVLLAEECAQQIDKYFRV